MNRSLLIAAWMLLAACPLAQAEPAPASAEDAIEPKDQVITLFNGRDLTGLYTWLADTKYDDPRKVFTVHDGLLHVSGDGYGYVTTSKAYKNYRLIAEFKWGPRTWGGRKDRTKDSRNPGPLHRSRRQQRKLDGLDRIANHPRRLRRPARRRR